MISLFKKTIINIIWDGKFQELEEKFISSLNNPFSDKDAIVEGYGIMLQWKNKFDDWNSISKQFETFVNLNFSVQEARDIIRGYNGN